MNKSFDIKEFFKGISAIVLYFILGNLLLIPFIFLINKNIITDSMAMLFTYILMTIIYILIYNKELKHDLKDFKKNYKTILTTTLKYWLIGLIIMILSNFLINQININEVVNAEQNLNQLHKNPLIFSLITITLVPIIEELTFRCSFNKFSNNKYIYAITTGLIFGFIHVMSSLTTPNSLIMLIYLIPYSAVGIAFGFAYKKTNNILGTIIFHAIHNTITLLEIILLGVL